MTAGDIFILFVIILFVCLAVNGMSKYGGGIFGGDAFEIITGTDFQGGGMSAKAMENY